MNNEQSYKADLQRAVELLSELARHPGASDKDSEAIDAFIDEMQRPVVKIHTEPFPSNPREDDNAGVMFCRHSRYSLGDKDAENPIEDVAIYDLGGYEIDEHSLDNVSDTLHDWCLRLEQEGHDSPDYKRAEYAYRWVSGQSEEGFEAERTERRLRDDVAIAIPLSLYDHGGITIYHGGPRDAWDSGCVGVHYMTGKTLDEEFGGDEAKARACMDAELKTYDQFLRGNVWYFTIEDRTGKVNECVGGFIGDDLDETGMLEHADSELEQAFRDAWDKRFER